MHLLFILLWCFALLGHFGLCVFIYNRINATALPRSFLKVFDKFLAIFFVAILFGILWASLPAWQRLAKEFSLSQFSFISSVNPIVAGWLIVNSCLAIAMGIPWLRYRPCFAKDRLPIQVHERRVNAVEELGHSPALSWRCRVQAKFPLNQIFQIAVTEKELSIDSLPHALDGLKIAHLSDLHLTGDVAPEFHALAMDLAARGRPDVTFVTGDIIDKESCIAWLERVLRPMAPPLGKYYVLGNHDGRVSDTSKIRMEMRRWGWIDVAGSSRLCQWNGCDIELLGSEVPWFGIPPSISRESNAFRILLSHSPDQIQWAREHNVKLMFAGHTHGGQGRLPVIGPILSPSWYGSRFASGEFYLPPTIMHVSRGLSGTHLARINCSPEVSLITLRRA